MSTAVIPFDEIVPGATVRVATIGGVQYLSIRDVIMCVCGKDGDHAGQVWRNLREDKKTEVRLFLANFKFPGPGQSEQPVITFQGALKLAMFLPGNVAKKHRSHMANILRRYYAGDASLVEELAENSRSDAPIAQMARASLAAEGGVGGELEEVRKRKREELEVLKLETEIRCMERTSQLQVMDKYRALCVDEDIDERAKIMFKDAILNSTLMGRALTNGGVSDSAVPISISQVATALGYTFDNKALVQVGRFATKLYQDQHGEAPSKHTQIVNGRATLVNNYFEPDRALLEAACRAYADRQEQVRRVAAETEARPLDHWLRGAGGGAGGGAGA